MALSDKLNKNDFLVLSCVWFSAGVNLMSDSINQLALYVALPFAFIVTFLSFGKFQVNKYFNLLVLLYIWILISVTWATDTSVALRQVKQILGSFILSYIVAVKSRSQKNIPWLYTTYIILLLFAWHYAYNNIFSVINLGEERINDEKLNANTLAYYTFYVTFAIYMLGDIFDKVILIRLFRLFFLLIIPLSFYTAIFTASRQILIIQIPFILILLYIRYIKGKSVSRKSIFLATLFACVFLVMPSINNVYKDSYLKERSESEIKEDSRTKLAKDAFKVGVEHFPLGVGPGNYLVHSYNKHFSHNTYLELFANEGVVGLFIYVYILYVFLKRQWKRYKRSQDNIYLSFFVFGIFFVIDGVFYSFYEHLWLIGFFVIVASHSELYYKSKQTVDIKTIKTK